MKDLVRSIVMDGGGRFRLSADRCCLRQGRGLLMHMKLAVLQLFPMAKEKSR